MTRKPKSWAALKKSIEAADISAMPSVKLSAKRADKLLLIAIAESGSDSGAGSHPGNEALMRACGCKWSQTHDHIILLLKAGMIQRDKVHGRGLASAYAILWKHPVFPDHSANGKEIYIEETSGFDETKPDIFDGKHPVTVVKTSGLEAKTSDHERKTSGLRPEDILPHPKPIRPSIPANHTPDGWKVFTQSVPTMMQKRLGDLGRKGTKEVKAEISKHGVALMVATATRWWNDRTPPAEGLTKVNPWWKFLQEYEPWLKEGFAQTPEGRAEKERQEKADEEASIALARKNNPAAFARLSHVEEESPEEFFDRLKDAK